MSIAINNLTKTFGEKIAVDIQQFLINDGDIIGLVGNNGAGKTTLFRLMLDLLKADAGNVAMTTTIEGTATTIDPATSEEWKEFTGAFINDGFLIDFLTPEEYFDFIAKVSLLDRSELTARLNRFDAFMAGEIVGQKRLIRDLSAGNQQKVGIIGAMLSNPRILILDEPFNFLDPSSQNILKHILRDYNHATQATIIVSSHNLSHTIEISSRIALMENGHIIRDLDNTNMAARTELENYFS